MSFWGTSHCNWLFLPWHWATVWSWSWLSSVWRGLELPDRRSLQKLHPWCNLSGAGHASGTVCNTPPNRHSYSSTAPLWRSSLSHLQMEYIWKEWDLCRLKAPIPSPGGLSNWFCDISTVSLRLIAMIVDCPACSCVLVRVVDYLLSNACRLQSHNLDSLVFRVHS